MSQRARRRAQTETEIADAAMQIVLERGLDALTIGRIAKLIGYTPGALYRYFPSKDAILAELHRRTVVEIEERMAERQAGVQPGLPPRVAALAGLVAAAEAYEDFTRAHPGAFRLVAMSLAEPRRLVADEHAGVAIPAYLSLFGRVSGLFSRALTTRALTTGTAVGQLTVAFALAIQGPLQVGKLQVHAPPGLVDTAAYTRLVVDGLLVGWGADPAELAAARGAAGAEPPVPV